MRSEVFAMTGLRRFSIGRDPSCDVVVRGASVSRQHAFLILRGDRTIEFEDARSTNGSYLIEADQPVRINSTFLQPEAQLRLGKVEVSLAEIMQGILAKVRQERQAG